MKGELFNKTSHNCHFFRRRLATEYLIPFYKFVVNQRSVTYSKLDLICKLCSLHSSVQIIIIIIIIIIFNSSVICFCVHGNVGCGQKSFTLVWWCQQFLSGFLAKGHVALSVASVTSVANDKGDNEMILGAVHRSPGISLVSDEGAVRPFIASNGVPFLQMRSVGSHSTSGREREGKWKGRVLRSPFILYCVNLSFI